MSCVGLTSALFPLLTLAPLVPVSIREDTCQLPAQLVPENRPPSKADFIQFNRRAMI